MAQPAPIIINGNIFLNDTLKMPALNKIIPPNGKKANISSTLPCPSNRIFALVNKFLVLSSKKFSNSANNRPK